MGIVSIPGFFEPFSSLLHLLVAAMILVVGRRIVRVGRSKAERVALGVFVFGAALLFGVSGTYHLLHVQGQGRAVMQVIDHAAIFVMIAGTFTAIHGVAFRGPWRRWFVAVVWVLAVTALTLKTIFFDSMAEWFSLTLYLGLGWVGIISAWVLWKRRGWSGVRWLLWGGVAYSVGAAYDFAGGPAWIEGVIGSHEVFHIAVVVGALFHLECVRVLIAATEARALADAQSETTLDPSTSFGAQPVLG